MSPILAEKADLRRAIGSSLERLGLADRQERSARICDRVRSLGWWETGGVLMLYLPFGTEVDIGALAQARLGTGRRICVPAFDVPTKRMWAVEQHRWEPDRWNRGPLGVPQTPPGPLVELAEISVVITPGIAFDSAGNRLGRGMGFYDRFLAESALRAVSVGVAFEEQIVGRVPREASDAALDAVVTERRVLLSDFRARRRSSDTMTRLT